MTFLLGLTGSIGMGKSTAAKLFAQRGCRIWDADQVVHDIYDIGGAAVPEIQKIFPDAIIDGAVSREVLKKQISKNEDKLKILESLVHPLVQYHRADFIEKHEGILVFDIPLLFEINAQAEFDAVACVQTNADIQRSRVMARPNMTENLFEMILSKQISSEEKAERSDYLICTDSMEAASRDIDHILADIKALS